MSCQSLLVAALCLTAVVVARPSAQSTDLDALMTRVLAGRDENWKKLQQYTLNERETLQVTALAVFRVFGLEREYLWFPRAGFFVRSPLEADGVAISEEKRRQEEERWLENAQNRERREAEKRGTGGDGLSDVAITGAVHDVITQTFEPDFIKSANFLRFKAEAGQYALAGRERMLDRDVLRIEYYPTQLFKDDDRAERIHNDVADAEARREDDRRRQDSGRDRPAAEQRTEENAGSNGRQKEKLENRIEAGMNKVSLVTMWVDPDALQILRYEFRIADMDFLPGSSLFRISGTRATMQMAEPFPNVWLPESIAMRFRLTSAAGPLEARYDVKYREYKLPTVSGRVR